MRQILWPHRLTVRTSAFQAENRGSIPRGVKSYNKSLLFVQVFVMTFDCIAGNRTEPRRHWSKARSVVAEEINFYIALRLKLIGGDRFPVGSLDFKNPALCWAFARLAEW